MRIATLTDSTRAGRKKRQAVLSAGGLRRCDHDVDLISYHPGNGFAEYTRNHGIRFVRIDAAGSLRLGLIREVVAHLFDGESDIAHCFGGTSPPRRPIPTVSRDTE
jgi:hypothetical protein